MWVLKMGLADKSSCHTPGISWGTSRSWLLLTGITNLLAID